MKATLDMQAWREEGTPREPRRSPQPTLSPSRRTAPFSVVAILSLASCAYSGAEAPPRPEIVDQGGRAGLLVMAHGGSEEWNAAVRQTVAPLEAEIPTAVAFGMADRTSLQEAVTALETEGADRIVVVRLFISGTSFLHRTEFLLGLRSDAPAREESPVSPSRDSTVLLPVETSAVLAVSQVGLSDSPFVWRILRERAAALSVDPSRESVLILAHGLGDDEANDALLATMDHLADSVRVSSDYQRVVVETLREDWDDRRAQTEERIRRFVQEENAGGRTVLVVPFRLYGFGPYGDVLDGLSYRADGKGFVPNPAITRWVRATAGEVFCAEGWANPLCSCAPGTE